MELIELENRWKEYDRKVTDGIRINKIILRKLLISKPEKRVGWMRGGAIYGLFSPLTLVIVVLAMGPQFSTSFYFYVGLCLFLPVFLISYFWHIRYFFLLRRLDFSEATLTIRKKLAELEKYMIKITRMRLMITPFAIIGVMLMLFSDKNFLFNTKSLAFISLMVIVFLSSFYYRFKLIYQNFGTINQVIKEIETLEKD